MLTWSRRTWSCKLHQRRAAFARNVSYTNLPGLIVVLSGRTRDTQQWTRKEARMSRPISLTKTRNASTTTVHRLSIRTWIRGHHPSTPRRIRIFELLYIIAKYKQNKEVVYCVPQQPCSCTWTAGQTKARHSTGATNSHTAVPSPAKNASSRASSRTKRLVIVQGAFESVK